MSSTRVRTRSARSGVERANHEAIAPPTPTRKGYDFLSNQRIARELENIPKVVTSTCRQLLLGNFKTKTTGSTWLEKLQLANAKRLFSIKPACEKLACYNGAFYFHFDRRLYSFVHMLDNN